MKNHNKEIIKEFTENFFGIFGSDLSTVNAYSPKEVANWMKVEIPKLLEKALQSKDTQWRDKIKTAGEKLKEGIGYGKFGFTNEKGEVCIKLDDALQALTQELLK